MVASTATRPELSDQAAGDYTIRKALAQGYVINNGMAPDGGVGTVTYSLNDNWDPLEQRHRQSRHVHADVHGRGGRQRDAYRLQVRLQ